MAFTESISELIASDRTGLLARHPSWERIRLAEIAGILNGAPFDSNLFATDEGMPLVRIRDVLNGVTSTYYSGPFEDIYLIKAGDLLIGMDGDFNSGYWKSHDAVLNQRVCKVAPDERYYDKRFLGFALPGYLAAINAATPSITVKHLSSRTIADIELPLPPRAEQTRIVAKLEELLSGLDAGVAELRTAQKKLAQYRQSLLKSAVEGALTADWRAARRVSETPSLGPVGIREAGPRYTARADNPAPETETGAELLTRILTERRTRWEAKQLAKFKEQGKHPPKDWQSKYPEPVAPDTRKLPPLPEGWVWASMDQIIDDGPNNGLYLPKERYGRGTPILRIDDYQIGWHRARRELNAVDVSEEDRSTYSLQTGDVVINRVNSMTHLGKSLLVTSSLEGAVFESNMMRLRLSDGVNAEFACYYLGSAGGRARLIRDAKWAVNQASINQQDVRRTPIPLPPIAEQIAIAAELARWHEALTDQNFAIDKALAQSAAQRQNILRAAFAGQLVPQDPNDEPAAKLLERIRAERLVRGAVRPGRRRAAGTRVTA